MADGQKDIVRRALKTFSRCLFLSCFQDLYYIFFTFSTFLKIKNSTFLKNKQVAQLSQTDRAAEWVSYGQKWKTGTGRQYFADIIGLPSTL